MLLSVVFVIVAIFRGTEAEFNSPPSAAAAAAAEERQIAYPNSPGQVAPCAGPVAGPAKPPVPTLVDSGPFGFPYGHTFTDMDYQDGGPVTAVRLRMGTRLNTIQVRYGDRWADQHGWLEDEGTLHTVELRAGEKITAAFGYLVGPGGDEESGIAETGIGQIGFRTDAYRVLGPYGATPRDGRPFETKVGDLAFDCQLTCFDGSDRGAVYSLIFRFKCLNLIVG